MTRQNSPPESAGDLAFLESTIKARLLELQVLQMWRKDPNLYVGDATESIFVIIKRNFAPPEDRLRSVIARERQIPARTRGRPREPVQSAEDLHANRH